MPEVDRFELVIPGPPKGQPRPRARILNGKAVIYPSPEQKAMEEEIRLLWRQAGSPSLGRRPLAVRVDAHHARPQGHWLKDGTLSAEGRLTPWPIRKPDADNAIKWVTDPLNGLAWGDDAQIVDCRFMRRWCCGNRHRPRERTELYVWVAL